MTTLSGLRKHVIRLSGNACCHYRGWPRNWARVHLGFAAAGAIGYLISRTQSKLEQLESEISSRGLKAFIYPVDVTDPQEVQRVFKHLPRCDVLINNAGGNKPEPFVDVESATLDHFSDLNIKSVLQVSQAAVRLMQRQKSGAIVNMSS
jgi:short-subunit dehydrogenase